MLKNTIILKSCCLLLYLLPALVSATEVAGQLEARVGEQMISFPVLKTDIVADIQGDLATVTVIQMFANPLNKPVHARYLFPMNKDAAVYEMNMEVGAERIKAQIQELQQAKTTFNKAKAEGKSAALLIQHRPNVFTQDIANLMPNLPIKVTMRYVQTVAREDGNYQLIVPLVVGPRYQPLGAGLPPQADPELFIDHATNPTQPPHSFGKWELESLPMYPPVFGLDIPETIEPERVSIVVHLHGGMPINHVVSRTHTLSINKTSAADWDVSLENGRVIDNRDFTLYYSLSGEHTQAGLLAHKDEHGGFFSMLIEPPALPVDDEIMAREMVFVLDCSGSMGGQPMDASKAFMRESLQNLRPTDAFRIIRFSDSATEFSTQPLPATRDNIISGLRYTQSLSGYGGTEMINGIKQALEAPLADRTMRIVVFLTDGYIGNEQTILEYINGNIGNSRIYAFGVGSSVNRYLLSEVARIGRGFVRYMDPTESVDEVAKELAGRLQSPVLTDISIDWGKLSPMEVNPDPIPDLFAGNSVRILGRYALAGNYTITVHGKVNGRQATLPLLVTLPDRPSDGQAIALIWARGKISGLMNEFAIQQWQRPSGMHDDHIKQLVTDLGLQYSLLTQWTAFVAVTERIYNSAPEFTTDTQVPLSMVNGVTSMAYGQANLSSFTGNSAPEPGGYLGMLLVGMCLAGWLTWNRQNKVLSI